MTDEIPERIREEARRLAVEYPASIAAWTPTGALRVQHFLDTQTEYLARALLAAERRGRDAGLKEAASRAQGRIRALPLPGENDTDNGTDEGKGEEA